MKGLQRIERPGWRSYFCRVYHAGDVLTKSFADREHGGRAQARAAAVAWLRETRSELGQVERRGRVVASKADGTDELVGVHVHERTTRAGSLSRAWVATWGETRGGKRRQKRKSFSVRVHGEDGARELARAQRREWERGAA